ncbi:EamA family transporter [Mycolicibacterium moriokaense]|uniref:Permease n=2 Tax=Mycolicibacterium moriokaense TaxID=39691 RepID=A0AAD1H978_9MYCO|nr:DMT family transporter [Mycolicibacterium moriokaense]ORB27169.1 EamA family transporter [Mycolicibacterium moriokaense]BBX00794.1 permease [Mycolicibacterium moriokaense]
MSAGSAHMPEKLVLGAVLSSLSFFCTAVVSALAKAAEVLTSAAVVLLFQNLICFLIILPFVLRGGLSSLKTEKPGLHVLRAVSGTACWYALFVAITMMPLTNAILLTFSAPLWMPLIARVLFREKVSMATWVGAAIGFVGVIMVLQPHHQKFNIGALIALAGALCLAIALMSVRWLGATEPTPRILFYYFGISTVLCTPFAIADWRPFGVGGSIYLIGIALALLMSQGFIVLAYRYASAVKVGPFVYTVIVFTALIDWVLWNHVPTLLGVVGIALVMGGGVIAVLRKASGCQPVAVA